MTAATTWYGRRGSVLLGPTENRVARWLAEATAHGRVTIRTVDVAAATHVERSEAYRITARLRVLGLFGIENDRGGNHNGRRFWRTAIAHDGAALDSRRHRQAWSRILAWSRSRRASVRQRLSALRGDHTRPIGRPARLTTGPTPSPDTRPGGVTFAEAMRRAGLAGLMDRWGVS